LSNRRGACRRPFPPLRYSGKSRESDMPLGPAIPKCPGCATQAARNAALRRQLTRLHAQVAQLQAQLKALQAQLRQTSATSHQPPSSDPPGRTRAKVRELSTRRRGGQPGHRGTTRPLVSGAAVDELHVCQPTHCVGCGSPLTGSDPSPLRHQVTELPPLQPTVTEYQLHALRCRWCGVVTRAPLPEGVPERAFGPRLQALVAVLSGAYRLSKRNIQQLLADCWGVELALGSISALECATSEALREPVAEARRFIQQQPVAHVDETGWREANQRAWLWTAVTQGVTVFLIRLSRGSRVAKELLGEAVAGIVVSDRWSGYRWVPTKCRQLCWAHLIREFRQMAEAGGAAAAIGEALGMCARQLFHWWHRVRDGTLLRSSFCVYATQLRLEVRALLREGAGCEDAKGAALCRALLQQEPALWTFVSTEGVAPTNNASERALRPVVLWRKSSFGTQSRAGSDFAERVLTVVATLRQQQRNILDYVTAACEAALRHHPAPSLLPPIGVSSGIVIHRAA
jgi:transposase